MMKHLKNLWSMRTSTRSWEGDNLQLLFAGDERKVSGVPLNYSMTGHVLTTSAHVTVHSIPNIKKKLPFLFYI